MVFIQLLIYIVYLFHSLNVFLGFFFQFLSDFLNKISIMDGCRESFDFIVDTLYYWFYITLTI